jgi:hypothetical protein
LTAGWLLSLRAAWAAEPAAPEKPGLAVGAKAPAFTLNDRDVSQDWQGQHMLPWRKQRPPNIFFAEKPATGEGILRTREARVFVVCQLRDNLYCPVIARQRRSTETTKASAESRLPGGETSAKW